MNDNYIDLGMTKAKASYRKFIRNSKVFLGLNLFKKNNDLKKFIEVQKKYKAYNSVSLGIKNVPINEIVGSVQKYADFGRNFVPKNEIVEDRWCSVYLAFENDISLPPVELYKVKNEYFVYDGNHRISVYNFLKFKTIEAEVIEYLPSTQNKEDIIYREQFLFEKEYDVKDIIFSEVHFYRKIKKEIQDFKSYLVEKEEKEVTNKEAAMIWHTSLYLPAIRILEANDLLQIIKDRTISDIFMYFLDHKYYKTLEANLNVVYSYAIIDFINHVKTYSDAAVENRAKIEGILRSEYYKIREIEEKMEMDKVILRKLNILRENTKLNFKLNYTSTLNEIDNYSEIKGILNYKEAVKEWYKEHVMDLIDEFKLRVSELPKRYSAHLDEISTDYELLFYHFKSYPLIYEKKYNKKVEGLVASYILDIYIPLVEFISRKIINENSVNRVYKGIYSKYIQLSTYNESLSLIDTAEMFMKYKDAKSNNNFDLFAIISSTSPRPNKMLERSLSTAESNVSSFLKDSMKRYEKLADHESVHKFEEIYFQYLDKYSNRKKVESKFKKDLEILFDNKDLNIFFKSRCVSMKLNTGGNTSFLEFYISIINSALYCGHNIDSSITELTDKYIKTLCEINYD